MNFNKKMNIFDQNCTFTLSMPIISLIDNKYHQYHPTVAHHHHHHQHQQQFNQNLLNYTSSLLTTGLNTATAPLVPQQQYEPMNNNNNNITTSSNAESDLTELSWLTSNAVDIFQESLNNNISNNTITPTTGTYQKWPTTVKQQQNDNFSKLKLQGNFSDFNGDLDSSFSSSISTSSSSSFNSSNENNENFAKFSSNLETIFKQEPPTKSKCDKNNYENMSKAGVSLVKRMKLNEYYENNVTNVLKDNKNYFHKTSDESTLQVTPSKPKQVITTTTITTTALPTENSNKPPLTLSCLIFMAIQESKYKCLPVREIYEWIETNFPYYKNAKTGWKSSIRHNLSFSKCFVKMDRLESCKFLTTNNNNQQSQTQQRTTSYIAGTCWQVNPECKAFLMQTLKKSSFWFKYNKSYPNLAKLVQNYYNNEENLQQQQQQQQVAHHHHHHNHKNNKITENKNEQLMQLTVAPEMSVKPMSVNIKEEEIYSNNSSLFNSSDNENYYEDDTSNGSSVGVHDGCYEESDDDVTKAAEILYEHKNSHLFNQHPPTTTKTTNSDLEIEVASTLVRLKSLIEIRS